MNNIDEGIFLDYTQPMTKEFIEEMKLIMNGNTENYSDIAFLIKNNRYMYFTCSCGHYETVLRASDKRIRRLEKECDCGNHTIIDDIETSSDDFFCIGSQLAVCYKDSHKIQIRIIPYGVKSNDSLFIKPSDYAYYLSYDKQRNYVSWDPQLIYTAEEFSEFNPEFKYFNHTCVESDISALSYYNEEMGFGYDFKMVSDNCMRLYEMMKPYIPTLYNNTKSDDIFAAADSIIRQILYPIYSNPEAHPFLKNEFDYRTDFYSYIHVMKEQGFNPEQYSFKGCFHVERDMVDGTSFDDIITAQRWSDMIQSNELQDLITYYTEITGKKITVNDRNNLLQFPSEAGSFVTYLRFIIRGAVAENFDISNTISRTHTCMKCGIIKSWNGRYSEQLWNKATALKTTTLSLDCISDIEKNATLDTLYKKLTAI